MTRESELFTLRPAMAEDLPLVMAIIAEAAAWLQAKGIDQWPSPPNRHWWRRAAAHIGQGEVFLALRGNEAVGTISIGWTDPYWSDPRREAGYVHRMAIRTPFHGQALGMALLSAACDHIRAQGRRYVRLDCLAGNHRLRRYYEDQEFLFRGEVRDRDYVAALYELAL